MKIHVRSFDTDSELVGDYHFIAAGADNVGSLGAHTWSGPFQLTAVLLAVTEATGAVTAVIGLIRKQ